MNVYCETQELSLRSRWSCFCRDVSSVCVCVCVKAGETSSPTERDLLEDERGWVARRVRGRQGRDLLEEVFMSFTSAKDDCPQDFSSTYVMNL